MSASNYVRVRVKAGSKRESLKELEDNLFEIEVREKAERNLANNRVREMIAERLKVPVGKIRILTGHHSPGKILIVDEKM
jgi:uncharacterized protein YggU (UPF0235/DUF167 family)